MGERNGYLFQISQWLSGELIFATEFGFGEKFWLDSPEAIYPSIKYNKHQHVAQTKSRGTTSVGKKIISFLIPFSPRPESNNDDIDTRLLGTGMSSPSNF